MPLDQKMIDTKKILIEKSQQSKEQSQRIIYIPGYFRIKVKNFTQMNLDSLGAQMNASLIFTVHYGNLDKNSVEKLKSGIILHFARGDAIKLKEGKDLEIKPKQDQKQKLIKFTIRKIFNLKIDSEVFWSPFQIINLIFTVTVKSVQTDQGIIKINLMDTVKKQGKDIHRFKKISYTKEGTFGNYDLAEKLMRAEYSNESDYKGLHKESGRWAKFENFISKFCKPKQKNFLQQEVQKDEKDEKDEKKEKIKKEKIKKEKIKKEKKFEQKQKFQNFQYAHFNIPLYKFPAVALATIFLPLWLLAIINLGIFFQDNDLGGRIGSIAALMIAFVALIPTIRKQIPPHPRIVFVEILVYFQTLTSLFALIYSISVRNDSNFNLVWYQSGLFLLSAIITILTIVIILFMMFLHQFFWMRKYNQELEDNKDIKQDEFDMNEWEGGKCDQQFMKRSKQNTKIQFVPYKNIDS